MIMLYTPVLGLEKSAIRFTASIYRDEMAISLDEVWSASGSSTKIWFVPGTQPEDAIKAVAPADWEDQPFLAGEYRDTAINMAETMIFHAPTVGTYSTWMIPGIDHPDFRRPE
jgi:hypothetical protein